MFDWADMQNMKLSLIDCDWKTWRKISSYDAQCSQERSMFDLCIQLANSSGQNNQTTIYNEANSKLTRQFSGIFGVKINPLK